MRRLQLLTLIWLSMLLAAIPLGTRTSSAATYGPVPGVNYDIPNYAYSPPLRKFVDKLPLLGAAGANNLGQYIPVAVPDTTTYPGTDYYEIALVQYREQMHSDLPPVVIPSGSALGKADPAATGGTLLRGYVQEHNGVMDPQGPHYLGPLIIAQKDRPVRIKFTNRLPVGAAGDLFIPVDTEIMGAGAFTTGDLANPASLVSGTFTQNRATLHLHGGLPGWTSDGTAHQWITPAGDTNAANYPKGMSAQNVPDMPVPENGSMTFFWPNQMSGRLMFYHDHAMGITGPNVYAGEAAGYLLVDPVERALTDGTTAGVPAMPDVPLVIQDKTFVPDAATLAATDPMWDTAKWGGMGSLWMPHVYMPNQDPFNTAGATPYGRWDYGPWFWPVFPVTGPMPLISHVPEIFMDTPVVNGTAYPYMEVDPKTYRLRILNAANDRMWNLNLFVADPAVDLTATTGGGLTEVRMVPATLNPAIPFPTLWQTQTSGMIPDVLDGRPGGVPDPALIGPAMIQIGTEGGLLPAPVVLPNTPVGYEQNKRNVVVLNVSEKNLFLGPAERADVIVDFSQYAGQTIILYNDSPAPVPAGDPRNDFYTGSPDQTASGGHATTLPGYGPNTRTVMQFRVRNTAAAAQFAPSTPPPAGPVAQPPAALVTALANAYAATLDPLVVNGVTSRIQDNSIPYTPQPLASITVTNGGSGYTSAPTVNFLGGAPGSGAAATAVISGGKVVSVTLDNPGSGYSYAPTIMFSGGGGFGAAAYATVANSHPMQPKAIQELFDPLGRMNATLGVELPFTTALTQTTIPLGFVDPPTEIIGPNEIQLWKITHNGVDSHAIHFHLVNVQVVNRVGWDGAIRLADPNEAGWKDTVRMNPLEDCIVAVKAKPPVLPFGQPDSIRPLDVTQPLGSTMNFTNVNPLTGNAPATPVSNLMTNFNNEYTWHCHLLGHEENDMMRVFVMTSNNVVPPVFTLDSAAIGAGVTLNWTDPTPYDYATGMPNTVFPVAGSTLNNPANEIGFNILRADGLAGGSFVQVGSAPANATSFTDLTAPAGMNRYQIVAYNAAGSTASNVLVATSVPPPAITTTSLPIGAVGIAYNQAVVASNGMAPLTFSVTAGSLPTSLSMAADGTISGTPTVAGTFNFTVTVVDALARSASANLSITIVPPVSIGTAALPNGFLNTAYSASLTGSGGTTPYTWSISAGALPAGLTLDSATGAISGTPTALGVANFTVTLTDGLTSASANLSINVLSALSITTASLPAGTVNVAYSQTLGVTGGTAPYTWSVASGALPSGLTLNASTGAIGGTPTLYGTYSFTAQVVDSIGNGASQALSIVINPAPVAITTTTLPNGSVGIAYSAAVAATGGIPPYTFAITAGALPGGLTLDGTTGAIAGTPAATGTFSFTVTATASNGSSASKAFTIVITLPLAITTNTLPNGTIGVSYSQNLAATGGVTPYTWALVSGALPANVTLSTGGRIRGVPYIPGTYNFTVSVTDSLGTVVTKAFTLVIAGALPAAPSNITASISGATRITVSWRDNSNTETSFNVYRSVNGGAFTAISVPRTATQTLATGSTVSYNDTTAVAGNTYSYYVTAVNSTGESAPTATVTVVFTLPAAPILNSLNAVNVSTTDNVTVNWTDVATNETSYSVQRATNSTFTTGVSTRTGLPANSTSWTDTGRARGVTYYYRVRAVNGVGNSAWSNVMSVLTP